MVPSQNAHAYTSRRNDIDMLIADLQEALTLKDSLFNDKEDWEHVADLDHIREQLTQIVKYTKASLDKW